MIDISKGRYWDLPWSLVSGCTPCSPGCEHCWALAMERRFRTCISGNGRKIPRTDVETHSDRLSIPLKRRKPTVYAVWNDLFHEGVPGDFYESFLAVVSLAPRHTFLVLTKREVGRRVFEIFAAVHSDKKELGLHDRWRRNYDLSRNQHWNKSGTANVPLISANLLFIHKQRTVNSLTDNNPTFNVVRNSEIKEGDPEAEMYLDLQRTCEHWWNDQEQQDVLAGSVDVGEMYGIVGEKVIFNKDLEGGIGEIETVVVDPYEWGFYPVKLHDRLRGTERLDKDFWRRKISNKAYKLFGEEAECHSANAIEGCLGEGHNVGWPMSNLWHGLTVCNQSEWDTKKKDFLNVPGKKFISHEPALERIDFGPELAKIAVLIAGAETGAGARPSHPDTFRGDRDQCAAAGVPFFFKGWGEWVPCGMVEDETRYKNQIIDGTIMCRIGRKKSGRLLDGRTHDDLPWLKP